MQAPKLQYWLAPAHIKHLAPSISELKYTHIRAHGLVCCQSSHLTGLPALSFSYIFRLRSPPNTITSSFTNKALQDQIRAPQFPAKEKKRRTGHDQSQEGCSAGKEVAKDGLVGEKASLLGGKGSRWVLLCGNQGPLCCVFGWWEAVWGATGIPHQDCLHTAPADVPWGIWLHEWWEDHNPMWCCSHGVCYVPTQKKRLCWHRESIPEHHGNAMPLRILWGTISTASCCMQLLIVYKVGFHRLYQKEVSLQRPLILPVIKEDRKLAS